MPIQWRNKMSVDGGLIDADHKHLIEIINKFESFSKDGLSVDEAMEILYALKFYASTHFKREERLQLLAGFPYAESHKLEHEELLGQLDHVVEEFRTLAPDANHQEYVKETAELLRHWLIDHVLNRDLTMKGYVELLRRETAGMETLSDMMVK